MDRLRALQLRLCDQAGQTMAEYAVVIVMISVVVIVAAGLLGTNITSLFTKSARGL